jgi:hypothetical protein
MLRRIDQGAENTNCFNFAKDYGASPFVLISLTY